MDIILVQMAIIRGKPALNRAKVQALTSGLRIDSPTLIVLPELFSTGYLDGTALDADAAESWQALSGEDAAFLGALAGKLGCWVAGTTAEKGHPGPDGNGGFRNLSLLFAPDGSERSRYAKIHPFSYGGEDRIFTRGNDVVTAEMGSPEPWVIQTTICYDLRFPELYRVGSLRGAHLILVQANWPQARQLHWETLLKARAIENQAYVAGVNCAGEQGSLHFAGGSLLVSPKGEVIAQGGEGEGVVRGAADLDFCKQWRRQFPALRDRMIEGFYRP